MYDSSRVTLYTVLCQLLLVTLMHYVSVSRLWTYEDIDLAYQGQFLTLNSQMCLMFISFPACNTKLVAFEMAFEVIKGC